MVPQVAAVGEVFLVDLALEWPGVQFNRHLGSGIGSRVVFRDKFMYNVNNWELEV